MCQSTATFMSLFYSESLSTNRVCLDREFIGNLSLRLDGSHEKSSVSAPPIVFPPLVPGRWV